MDREYTEFVNGVALVITVGQLEAGRWVAAAEYLNTRREAQADTAKRARSVLVEAIKHELPRAAED